MKIGTKLVSAAAASLILTSAAILLLTSARLSEFSSNAQTSLHASTSSIFEAAVSGALNLVSSTDEALKLQVEKNMEVGMFLISSAGSLGLLEETQSLSRLNQKGEVEGTLNLRIPAFGETKILATDDASASVPIVDALSGLVGGAATVFQRVNTEGDFTAVATSIIGPDKKRSIGLSLPARQPDGSSSPVVARVLNGERYVGVLNLRGQAYVAAVQPLMDMEGDTSAALFVGVLQSQFESLRNTLSQTRIGGRGSVFVMQGHGENRGSYLLSPDGSQSNQNMLAVRDGAERLFAVEMLEKAIAAADGKVVEYEYMWRNSQTESFRPMRVALSYYAPWDWVIGAQAYEEDFEEGVRLMKSLASRTLLQILGVSVLAVLLASLGFWWVSQGISRRLQQLMVVAQTLARGDVMEAESILSKGSDEI